MQVEQASALEHLHGQITDAKKENEATSRSLRVAKEESTKLQSQLATSQERCTTLLQGSLTQFPKDFCFYLCLQRRVAKLAQSQSSSVTVMHSVLQ